MRLLLCYNTHKQVTQACTPSNPMTLLSLRSRDAIAADLRDGSNPRLPVLTAAGKRQAEACATLLRNGCALPLWAVEG